MRDINDVMRKLPTQAETWAREHEEKPSFASFYNFFQCKCCGLRTDWITNLHAQSHGYEDRRALIEAGMVLHNGKPYHDKGHTKRKAGPSKTKKAKLVH